MSLSFIHRDDQLAVINKPSGLSVHRGWAAHEPTYAVDLLRDAVGARVHPVHRLDRATSGVLVFALDPESAAHIGRQLEQHEVEKRYVALVRGRPPDTATIDHAFVAEDETVAREAVTDVAWLASIGRYSLVAARPRTGRPHQIRRHLKHIACPIIGDVRYGKGEHNRLWRSEHGLHRLALHAVRLELRHPKTEERLVLQAPLPADLSDPLLHAGFDLSVLATISERFPRS